MLRFWWLTLVPYWISFPTLIHMLHSDLGCENHTTSKNEDFHQISAFLHTTAFWSGCQLQPPKNPLKDSWKSTERQLKIPLKTVEICWKIPLEKLKISLCRIGSHPDYQSDVSAVKTTNFSAVSVIRTTILSTASTTRTTIHRVDSSLGICNVGQ